MLLIKIPKNRMNYLIEQVQALFMPETLDRGWDDYHKGRVFGLDLPDGLQLTAEVAEDQAMHRVELHLDDFAAGGCDCAEEEPCHHMAAVFFAAYAAHGRPELLLMQLRTAMAARARLQRSSAQRQARGGPDKTPPQVTAEQLPKGWQRFFEQRFHGYTLSQQNSIELFVSVAQETLLPFAKGWPKELRALFELHVIWYVMRKIETFAEQNQSSYLSYHLEQTCKTATGECWRRLIAIVDGLNAERLAKNHPEHWNETMAMAQDGIAGPKSEPVSWLTLYRYLWWKLFARVADLAAEKKRLDDRLAHMTMSRRRDALVHARAFFDVMQGDDPAAFARYEQQLQVRFLPEFLDVLELLRTQEDWRRLLDWLRWLLPTLVKARQDDFQSIAAYWEDAIAHLPNDEEWLAALKALLPRSYPQYSAYLLETGRFRAWVDLHLSINVSISSIAPDQLKKVEASDPSLLLPLFHLAVEKEIREKNRTAYTNAIRYLRKLQSLYRKLEQPGLWSLYMQRLVQKHARLRAFQEELKKGKWAP